MAWAKIASSPAIKPVLQEVKKCFLHHICHLSTNPMGKSEWNEERWKKDTQTDMGKQEGNNEKKGYSHEEAIEKYYKVR